MKGRVYIVPTELLSSMQVRAEWHATAIPGDPMQTLLSVDWRDNHTEEDAFEAMPGVLFLGEAWEALPDSAAPLLASFQADILTGDATAASLPSTEPALPPTMVSAALRATGWPGCR